MIFFFTVLASPTIKDLILSTTLSFPRMFADYWCLTSQFVALNSDRVVIFSVLIAPKGNAWDIQSQFWSLQQKANDSFSYLKDLDMFKGTEKFDVKSAISSKRRAISESSRVLKKNISESGKGKDFDYAY